MSWWIDYFEADRGMAYWAIEDTNTHFTMYHYERILKIIYLDLIDYENVMLPPKCNKIEIPACLYRTIRNEGWYCTLKYGVIG